MKSLRFARCLGLNTVSAPQSLIFDPRSGAWEAALAVNVDFVDGGRRWRTKPGCVRVESGNWRDGFDASLGGHYAVKDDVLVEVLGENSTRALMSLLTFGRVAWTDLDDLVFWSNGLEKGLIQDGEAVAWGGVSWPVASEAHRFESPPAGQVLGSHGGRIWIGVDSSLCFTEGAGGWHFWQPAANIIEMPGRITMIRGLAEGLYVGTSAGVYYLAGTDPDQMRLRRVFSDPTIPGLDAHVQADNFGKFDPVRAVVWVTPHDVCLGLPDGLVVQLIKDRVALDAPASTGGLVLLPKRLVAVLHP